jgi:hypothetical protein
MNVDKLNMDGVMSALDEISADVYEQHLVEPEEISDCVRELINRLEDIINKHDLWGYE